MEIKYKVTNSIGTDYGSFSKYEDAREHAQETADYAEVEVFIYKVASELMGYFLPEESDK